MISNGTSYIGPGSAAKPLQEESKKDTKEKLTIETPNPSEKVTELPDLYEVPTFMGRPLILKNEKGATVFNKEVAEALISSVTTTISDVLTFSSSIKTVVDSANPGEQVLEMVSSCFAITRSVYAQAVRRFFLQDIFNFYIKEHQLPMAILATVL